MTMYFILNCCKTWILPPGCNIFLAIIGFGIYFFQRTLAIILIFTSLITLWLFSMPIFAYNLIEILQNQYKTLVLETIHPNQQSVIVVLGGGDSIYVEQSNKHGISDVTLNRLRYAALLHKKTNLPIIISGGATNGAKESEAELMLNSLRNDFNIMDAMKEEKSINTADESKILAPFLKQKHFENIYLITNAWHMPRSVYLFQQQGIQVIPAPMGYEVYDHRYSALSYFPNTKALATTAIAFHELLGLVVA